MSDTLIVIIVQSLMCITWGILARQIPDSIPRKICVIMFMLNLGGGIFYLLYQLAKLL